MTVKPDIDAITNIFSIIEKNNIDKTFINLDRRKLRKILCMDEFVNNIRSKIYNVPYNLNLRQL